MLGARLGDSAERPRRSPARAGAHKPSRRARSLELPTPRRRVGVRNPVPLPMRRHNSSSCPRPEKPPPACDPLRRGFGHKASVHTSDAPSPGPSLRNYTPDFKNAHARARAYTHTHGHAYPPLLLCFHCSSVSFQRGVRGPSGFRPAEAAAEALAKRPSFLDEGKPPPPPRLELGGTGTWNCGVQIFHFVSCPHLGSWRWQFRKGMRRAGELGWEVRRMGEGRAP